MRLFKTTSYGRPQIVVSRRNTEPETRKRFRDLEERYQRLIEEGIKREGIECTTIKGRRNDTSEELYRKQKELYVQLKDMHGKHAEDPYIANVMSTISVPKRVRCIPQMRKPMPEVKGQDKTEERKLNVGKGLRTMAIDWSRTPQWPHPSLHMDAFGTEYTSKEEPIYLSDNKRKIDEKRGPPNPPKERTYQEHRDQRMKEDQIYKRYQEEGRSEGILGTQLIFPEKERKEYLEKKWKESCGMLFPVKREGNPFVYDFSS